MNRTRRLATTCSLLLLLALAFGGSPARADGILVQCPGDTDGDAIIDSPDPNHPDAVCKHLVAGDGYVTMADGTALYMFGFADVTGSMPDMVMHEGMLAGNFPAPTIVLDEGTEFYLTLTNVGMMVRPDLFDPHSVHFHGFPQASAIFDGVPEASVVINMGASFTYYYNIVEPGTYLYHCHVEATEHMQMGMLGNLYVRPRQNGTPIEYPAGSGRVYTQFAYNDGDGSTGYDVEIPLQLSSFDAEFHNASETVQPLPFALMVDDYAMINGRGYPDTLVPGPLPPPTRDGEPLNGGKESQPVSSLIQATSGQRVLLRISNLSVTRFFTLSSLGIPMKIVGHNAKLLRGPGGADLSYLTHSVTLGGGESLDAILDTQGVAPGTYFLYTTNLHYLSNYHEDFGGMMTEIVIQ